MSWVTRRGVFTGIVALALLAPGRPVQADDDECSDAAVSGTYRCREVVVEYRAGADLTGLAARNTLRFIGHIPQLRQAWFEAPAQTPVPDLLDVLSREPGVLSAERNGDFVPPECKQWNLAILELGSQGPWLYRSQPALSTLQPAGLATAGGGVLVAVLDTGVSRSHPALQGRLTPRGIDPVGHTRLADDAGNGVNDDARGEVDDGWGHGTSVAGLIALAAPGATILPVRVLDDECRGSAFALAYGVVAAVDAGARVLNLSFGAADESSVIKGAFDYARDHGVTLVAPAGNSPSGEVLFPASYGDTIAVGAVNSGGIATPWTSHGSRLNLVAPGDGVVAPYRNGYAALSGTSFSSAFVSAAAAIVLWATPGLDAPDLRDRLLETARSVDPQNPELRGKLGEGIPDLRALARPVFGRRFHPLPPVNGRLAVPPGAGETGGSGEVVFGASGPEI